MHQFEYIALGMFFKKVLWELLIKLNKYNMLHVPYMKRILMETT